MSEASLNGEKIGILGGVFDPPHKGHLALAQAAKEQAGLDKVLFMISPDPYYKDASAPFAARHEMLKLALKGFPEFSPCLLEREHGFSCSAQTLSFLKENNPGWELFFIVGGDTLFSMHDWKEPQKIFSLCTILASKREDEAKGEASYFKPLEAAALHAGVPETLLQAAKILEERFGAKIKLLSMEQVDISSGKIRKSLIKNAPCRDFLPEAVFEYIKENHLYGV